MSRQNYIAAGNVSAWYAGLAAASVNADAYSAPPAGIRINLQSARNAAARICGRRYFAGDDFAENALQMKCGASHYRIRRRYWIRRRHFE